MGNILVPSGTSFNPWYTAHAHKHVRIHTSCALLALAHTHTPCHENGGGGGGKVKHFSNGTGSVGTVGATQHTTASNMWTGMTGSCCG